MKKIAIFVEGQTEQIFVNKLLKEIAGQRKISINLFQLRGGSKTPIKQIYVPQSITNPTNPKYEALIYDSGSDSKVKSDILDNIQSLAGRGYSQIIGLRDLYPLDLSKLHNLEQGMLFFPQSYLPLPLDIDFVIAVSEVEAWFLGECNHYECIDSVLLPSFLISNLSYDPCTIDTSTRTVPSDDLKSIYQLVGKTYNKKKDIVERTVECLDYANLYLNVRNRVPKLGQFIDLVDAFLD